MSAGHPLGDAGQSQLLYELMKLLWSMIISVAVLALVVPYVLRDRSYGGADSPIAAIQKQFTLPSETLQEPEVSPADGEVGRLYRWRDANGTLHLESNPPSDGSPYETITYTKPIPEESEEATDTGHEQPQKMPEDIPAAQELLDNPLKVYTPEGFDQLLEQVDKTAQQLNERDRLLETLGDDL